MSAAALALALIALPLNGGFEAPRALAQVGTTASQITPSPHMVLATFVRVHRIWGRDLRQRFQVQIADGNIVEYELVTTGLATRNGQPARLIDLQPGDRVLLYRIDPGSPIVLRVDAESAMP